MDLKEILTNACHGVFEVLVEFKLEFREFDQHVSLSWKPSVNI